MTEPSPRTTAGVSAGAPETRKDPGDRERALVLQRAYGDLKCQIAGTIVGQHEAVELMLVALFAGGHSILIGVPGLAKTLLVNTLARLLSLTFKRIQFTPDLMPSDITGTDIIQEDPETGVRSFRFIKGPVFTHMLLADEINRTPPKTQAALLEAMQERHVTVGERTLPLPSPFFVIATQNPIEQEGTYNLPEAQLDRFLLSIRIGYPSEEEELEIMKRPPPWPVLDRPRGGGGAGDSVTAVLDAAEILRLQELVPRVPAAEHVCRFALRLTRSTRPGDPGAPAFVREWLALGAGPRAAQNLLLAAKARALLHGRFHVNVADVAAVATAVLSHRLVTNFQAEAEGVKGTDIVARLLAELRREAPPGP